MIDGALAARRIEKFAPGSENWRSGANLIEIDCICRPFHQK
jgi:hypothetical protein